MTVNSLETLFEEEIKDLYDAEKQLVKALPKMAKAASSEELRSAFEEHLEITREQVKRLEEVFQSMGAKPKGKTCEGMKGLVAEGEEAIEKKMEGELHDILLTGAAKRVEHYEMGAYQSAISMAESLGNEAAVELLRQTLSEEEEADEKMEMLCSEILRQVSSSGGSEAGEERRSQRKATPAPAKTRRAGGA